MATQEQRRAATSSALRTAGRRLFSRKGFPVVQVDQIATTAGVTRGAFYHHFPSKEALFEAIFEEAEAELVSHAAAAARNHRDPREQLRSGCLAFIDAASGNRYRRIVLVDGPTVLGMTRYREIDAAHFLPLLGVSLAGLRPDRSSAENELLGRALLAALCECALNAVEDRHDAAAVDAVVSSLVDGL